MRRGVLQRLAARGRDDDGIALIVVLGTMTMVSLLLFAVLAYALADTRPARADEDSTAAMAAAQAGVDDYLARLSANDTYWTTNPSGNGTTSADSSNAAFTSSAAVPGTGGSVARYSYRVLNSIPNIATSGTIQLQVTGTSTAPNGGRAVSRTLVASLKTSGFLSYLYFTDVEALDPVLWDTQANATATGVTIDSGATVYASPAAVDHYCSQQYWNGRVTSSYVATTAAGGYTATVVENGQTYTIPGYNGSTSGQVTISGFCDKYVLAFFDHDSVNGPMHTNDVPYVWGNVTFGGTTTSYWPGPDTGTTTNVPVPHPSGGVYYRSNGGTPQGNQPVYGPYLPMPPGDTQLLRYVLPKVDSDPNTDRPGCLYSGATKIVFHGSTMSVTSPNSASATSACLPQGPSVTNPSVPVPPVIYVQQASGSCTGVGYPATGEVTTGVTTDYNPCHGTAFVSGTVGAQVTVGTADDIVVTGDLTYTNASGTNVLGLIANNDVWVYHPVDSSGNNLVTDPTQQVHNISAAILSLQHSFLVQNYGQGAPLSTSGTPSSYLNVTGSIAQKFRGPVTGSGGANNGYLKNYGYDPRFRALQPPYFIKPLSTPWTLTSVSDG